MLIHVVESGDTITSIANEYGISPERIIIENELPNPEDLVVGQSIAIVIPDVVHTVVEGDTLYSIAEQYDVDPNQILQNNPVIAETEFLVPGQTLVISYRRDNLSAGEKLGSIIVNGYAYPFIDRTVLRKTLPYLTYLSLFTYGFTPAGDLVPIDDAELIELAKSYGVQPIMVLAPMDEEMAFSNEIAHQMFINPEGQARLIDNILATIQEKGYAGIDIDFEFVLPEDRQNFATFIQNVKNKLEPAGFIVMVALAPKTSGEMAGVLYEAHDYPVIGGIADLVLLMTYEWGYTYGPPMATAPLNNVRRVLEYGVSVINPDIILMGIPNYAYDWPLPFVRGETAAESISNQEAIERAALHNVIIEFDEPAQAPFYRYTNDAGVEHVVWFDDARSMNAKVRLINELGLTGMGVWQIMNFFPQMWIVIRELYNIEKVPE
ncbi:MAG: hypothetical protein K0S47_3438 [Herbinix sp.]|jgi:spore germination protein|nr:hypothetical protein [Herbinix sp.]